MCIHNSCDSESLCPCCRKHGRDHDASACTPIQQQLRDQAGSIRKLWEDHEPPAWNQSVWHRWMKDMAMVEMLERAAAAIEDARAEARELRGWKGDALATYQVCAMDRDIFRAQRDEARRQYCLLIEFGKGDGTGEANARGWDCFKEGKP